MSRGLKKKIKEKLHSDRPDAVLSFLESVAPREAITPLISALYSQDQCVRWNAIAALGRVLARMAQDDDMEHARTIMRRFIWSLNDESGGIGWGAAEAMAEAMVQHKGLYEEYARILLSYIREDGNYLEYPPLRRGALWGLGRLGHVRPSLLREIGTRAYLLDYLQDSDAQSRALAAWALGAVGETDDIPSIERLLDDREPVDIYIDGRLRHMTVGQVARQAIERLGGRMDHEVISFSPDQSADGINLSASADSS